MTPGLFRIGALTGLAATLALIWAWQRSLGGTTPGIVLASLATVMALPALPGLLRGRSYTYAWSSMLALPYIGLALVESYANPAARSLAVAMLVASSIWFLSCLLYVRGNRARVQDAAQ